MLTGHPEINGLFCANDMMAFGAINAIEGAGKAGKIIVFDYRPGGKRHRVKAGHRQNYTAVKIDEIERKISR